MNSGKITKIRGEHVLTFLGLRSAKVCKSDRSPHELSNEPDPYTNEYLLAKMGFDKPENEFPNVCQKVVRQTD